MNNSLNSFAKLLHPSKKTVLLILLVAAITVLISAAISMWLSKTGNLRIPSVGNVITLGAEAYWDKDCENKTEKVDWNMVWPGSSKNVTLYLRSMSNVDTKLNLNTTNWNPADISDYINLSWNYNGTPVTPHQVVRVTLTLSASSSYSFINYLVANNVNEFGFDMTIYASEEY